MKKAIFILAILLISNTRVNTQGIAINTDGSSTDASAMLDIKSTSKGMLIPRMTQSERNNITSPATGLLIYQTNNTPGFYFYNGTAWIVVGSEALDINSLADGKTAGNSVFLSSGAGANNVGTDNKNVSVGYEALYSNTTGTENAANGFHALFYNTIGGYNTANGNYALYSNTTGINNTAFGYATLSNTSSGYNTANGFNALCLNTIGINNTANGNMALYNNTTGGYNTSFGASSLYSNLTGSFNTATGYRALCCNTTGTENTANGFDALYFNTTGLDNTANGEYTLYYNTTGTKNTANGVRALNYNTIGGYNTANGYAALFYNTTGNYNTAIGFSSGPPYGYTNLENTTALGYSAEPLGSNGIAIGNTSVNWIGGQTVWSTYSDSRAKNNIKEDVIGLDFIMKLSPLSWYWDKDKLDAIIGVTDLSDYKEKYDIEKIKQSGFLAQEVEKAAVESGYKFSGVHAPKNKHTPYSISYEEFVVPIVKAIQEQQEAVTKQQQMIEILKGTYNNQLELIETFQVQNKALMKRLEQLDAE